MSNRASRPTEAVAERLHATAIHVLRHVRREDRVLGIGPAALSALSVLVFAGPRSLTALADAEQVRPPTMSRIVDGLVRAGHAQRTRDRGDGRSRTIRATARGRIILRRGRARRIVRLARLLATLGPDDLASVARAARLVEAALVQAR